MAEHICPVWIGYLLASPIRKLFQNPDKILEPYVKEGMQVADIGSAMGFFSLPMARMTGEKGRVLCIDIQDAMLKRLEKKAAKAGLSERIQTITATEKSFGLQPYETALDFILAFAVVHETPNPEILFRQSYKALKPEGYLLIAEPGGHVTKEAFDETIGKATRAGFNLIDRPNINRSLTGLFVK